MTDEMNPAMRDLFLGGEDEEAQDVQSPGLPERRPTCMSLVQLQAWYPVTR